MIILIDDSLAIGGVHPTNSGGLKIALFSKDANPIQTSRFCVLSVHWNASGKSGCGLNKSGVYFKGKELATFTAATNIGRSTSFTLGNLTYDGHTGWEPPHLLTSSVMYPWTSETMTMYNDIEMFNFIHISGNNGSSFIAKTLSPIGMRTKTIFQYKKFQWQIKSILNFQVINIQR